MLSSKLLKRNYSYGLDYQEKVFDVLKNRHYLEPPFSSHIFQITRLFGVCHYDKLNELMRETVGTKVGGDIGLWTATFYALK